MNTPLKGDPIAATACDAQWIATRRAALRRDGNPIRAGAGNTIELKSLTPVEQLAAADRLRVNHWGPIALPNEAIAFTTAQDRDAVLAALQEGNHA